LLIPSELPQPTDCLHKVILRQVGAQREHRLYVSAHPHVGSSRSVLIEDDESLMVGNERSQSNDLLVREVVHCPTFVTVKCDSFEFAIFVEVAVVAQIRDYLLFD
jgi:hypothetical protein